MELGSGTHRYEVVEGWGALPAGKAYGYTHGVVTDKKDNVYIHNQSKDAVAIRRVSSYSRPKKILDEAPRWLPPSCGTG